MKPHYMTKINKCHFSRSQFKKKYHNILIFKEVIPIYGVFMVLQYFASQITVAPRFNEPQGMQLKIH